MLYIQCKNCNNVIAKEENGIVIDLNTNETFSSVTSLMQNHDRIHAVGLAQSNRSFKLHQWEYVQNEVFTVIGIGEE